MPAVSATRCTISPPCRRMKMTTYILPAAAAGETGTQVCSRSGHNMMVALVYVRKTTVFHLVQTYPIGGCLKYPQYITYKVSMDSKKKLGYSIRSTYLHDLRNCTSFAPIIVGRRNKYLSSTAPSLPTRTSGCPEYYYIPYRYW